MNNPDLAQSGACPKVGCCAASADCGISVRVACGVVFMCSAPVGGRPQVTPDPHLTPLFKYPYRPPVSPLASRLSPLASPHPLPLSARFKFSLIFAKQNVFESLFLKLKVGTKYLILSELTIFGHIYPVLSFYGSFSR